MTGEINYIKQNQVVVSMIADFEIEQIEIAWLMKILSCVQIATIISKIWQFVNEFLSDSNEREFRESTFKENSAICERLIWCDEIMFELVQRLIDWLVAQFQTIIVKLATMQCVSDVDELDDSATDELVATQLEADDEIDELDDFDDELDVLQADSIDELDDDEHILHLDEHLDDDEVVDDDSAREIDETDEMVETATNERCIQIDETDEIVEFDEDDETDETDEIQATLTLQHSQQIDENDETDSLVEIDEADEIILQIVNEWMFCIDDVDEIEYCVDEMLEHQTILTQQISIDEVQSIICIE